MSNIEYKDMVLDARPDRMDLRDREYRPHLSALPPQFPSQSDIETYLPVYIEKGLILNQGQEGACTGFGLAATINYLIWRDKLNTATREPNVDINKIDIKPQLVSERMLYHMAQVYDEWDGEDYSGSSCRGAMKGWHRHGVCKKTLWQYDVSGKFLPPENDSWANDALSEPLGAYYRINHKSVVDMQAAISEVGAIYCSANVHEGWWLKPAASLPVIKQTDKKTGGHAFCMIGYNEQGFIVQNSWGDNWGWHGFAILQYADWVANGSDAWVVSRGVPIQTGKAPQMFANNALQDVATDRSDPKMASINKALKYPYPPHFAAMPWTEDEAYAHALVISNNGRPKQTVIAAENGDASAKHITYQNLRQWMQVATGNRKVMVYAHGGLNSEEDSINRVRVMAPYFKANGIYPLFVIWKTGFGETINNMVREAVKDILDIGPAEAERAEGIGEWISDKTDRAIEATARNLLVKGMWSEMKENAIYASDRAVPGFAQNKSGKAGAMVILAESLQKLNKEFSDLELHIAGHSAGSILLGEWLNELIKRKLTVKTVSLYAPACTIEFANKTYLRAIEKGVFKKKHFIIHNMDDERERADNTGKVYRKSLLYLVSRALEDVHKMPILGLTHAWDERHYEDKKSGGFHDSQKGQARKWTAAIGVKPHKIYNRKEHGRVQINLNPDYIDLSHGSFDNDIEVVEFTLKKMTGVDELTVPVVNLCGY